MLPTPTDDSEFDCTTLIAGRVCVTCFQDHVPIRLGHKLFDGRPCPNDHGHRQRCLLSLSAHAPTHAKDVV